MYTPVIGLEIHLQLNTKSKMFCRCSAEYFDASPNTHVCQVCLGLPGALPMPNQTAIEKVIGLALALNCKVATETKFDRKNYYYPDLPKGFQISQFDQPIGQDGYVEIEVGDDSRRVRIQRIHLEEDTAKSLHADTETLIDFNKSGVALAEIVTYPDFQSIEEVLNFAKRLRQIVRYTNSSEAEMQKGHMRYELNISVKETSAKELPPYKVEVKNIGSISVLEKVINFEVERQSKELDSGAEIKSQTRGLKDMSGETLFQRSKETADDYRYFPEPDLPAYQLEETYVEQIKAQMPELPLKRKQRYLGYGLELEQADIFVEDIERGNFFDLCANESAADGDEGGNLKKELAKWINTDLAGLIQKKGGTFINLKVKPADLIYLITLINQKKITAAVAKSVLDNVFESGDSAEEIIAKQNLLQISDSGEIEGFVDKVISENQKIVEDISKNPNAVKFLVGLVMRESKGRVNPNAAEQLIKEKLSITN